MRELRNVPDRNKKNYYYKTASFLLLLILAGWQTLPAQQTSIIKGTITDTYGETIIGANIIEKGTINGTVTDWDGNFTLSLSHPNSVLTVSYIGYHSQEIDPAGKEFLTIRLTEDTQKLDEVVVIGYGVQKKKDLTGAVSILEIGDLKDTPVSSVDQMMQGKLSGVNVIPDNMPGGGVAVRVRGFSTIRNNDPLYIIDGVPVEGGINFLNPNDIESMQVLKDASSASIYGARAANGVVIISTKKGKEGVFNVTLDAYVGVQTSARQLRMLNAQEYGDLLWEAQKNDGKTPVSDIYGTGDKAVIPAFLDVAQRVPSADVDWVDAIMQNALVQSYNVSFSKADQVSNQLFSVGYFDQEGLMKYTGFERVTGRFNSEYKLFNNRIKIGENLSLSHSWGTTVSNNAALGGMLYNAYKTVSITPIYDLDGNFAGNPIADIQNPLGQLYRNKDNSRKSSRAFGNVYGEVDILDGLTFKTTFGMDYQNQYYRRFSPKFIETQTQQPTSNLNTSNTWIFNWVFTNTIHYVKSLDRHTIGLLAGIEANRSISEWFAASREGFASDDDNFHYLDAGDSSSQKNSGAASQSSLMSYFGKVDYNFDNRYLVGVTLRRDGSSKLGDNKWGNFPAVSAGWRISSEPFYTFDWMSNLKIRAGWGQNGNSDIPPYSTIDSYASDLDHSNYPIDGSQNSVTTGYTQTRNGNPNLKWETTTQTNIGVDIGLLNNDLGIVIDWFNKNTKDLLWERSIIGTIGGTNEKVWDNVGKMNNKGIEMEINYKKSLNKDFGFSVALNLSRIKNKMTELNEDVSYIGLPSSVIHSLNFDQEVSRSAVGHPIGSFYVYREAGLFQSEEEIRNYTNSKGELLQPDAQPGDIKFVDVNGDGVIDGNDRDFVGDPMPDITTGLTLGVTYKNFDISLFFQGMFGNEVYDMTSYIGEFFNQSQYNKSERIKNAWRPDHTNTTIPRLTMDDPNNNIRPSSYYVHDTSFVRLKNIKIGYTFPQAVLSKIGFSNLYLYVQATNLFTITGYQGIDPEVGLQSYSTDYRNLDMGVDRGIYPLSRTFTLGLNASF
ncbi:MAG: TonB-dependent receptor [Tannerellaceae bacterium]|nr:TonB-dependent receptor [Tannerellaceae bacterium]